MPYSPRGQIKREIDQARNQLERAAAYLLRIRARYDPDYPEYVAALDCIIQCISDTVDALERFRDHV